MAEPVVLQNLGKAFRTDRQENVALQNVNLAVRAGEFVTLIGPSGCGKSTLLRLAGDLLPPTTGTESLPFAPVKHKRVAVKIVDDRGIESLRIKGKTGEYAIA